jgi:hypothetical protein
MVTKNFRMTLGRVSLQFRVVRDLITSQPSKGIVMPRKFLKRLVYVAATFSAALAGSVGLVAASPAPAQAAGSCYYSSCYNVDPQTSGCSADAYTIGWDGGVEFRFSPSCQATWLRDSDQGFSWASQLTQYTYNSNKSYLYGLDFPWSGWSGTWTRMVPMPTSGFTQYHANNYWSGLYNTDPV